MEVMNNMIKGKIRFQDKKDKYTSLSITEGKVM
jgi:hypothetical protein